jgi:hypothetical protein
MFTFLDFTYRLYTRALHVRWNWTNEVVNDLPEDDQLSTQLGE